MIQTTDTDTDTYIYYRYIYIIGVDGIVIKYIYRYRYTGIIYRYIQVYTGKHTYVFPVDSRPRPVATCTYLANMYSKTELVTNPYMCMYVHVAGLQSV